jgi:hypothetical protein
MERKRATGKSVSQLTPPFRRQTCTLTCCEDDFEGEE